MNEIITEKNYPIKRLWIFKLTLKALLILIFLAVLSYFSLPFRFKSSEANYDFIYINVGIVSFFIFHLIIAILRRANFHYSIEEKFMTLKQGILSKQQKHIPYGVIQNIIIKQDLSDRILGLASLIIENASQGAGAFVTKQQSTLELPIFFENRIIIPGLAKRDAEILKEIILQKIKENPIEDDTSGL